MTDIHERVAELVPWFINGTLPEDECSLVEQHIRECLPCRRAVEEESSVRDAIRTMRVPTSAEHGLDSLLATIEGRRNRPPRARTVRRFRPTPGAGWIGLAAGACAVVVLITLQSMQQASEPAGYPAADGAFTTLSEGTSSDDIRIDVIFAALPDESALRRFTDELGATSVAGPTELGRYTFTLPVSAEPQPVLDTLRSDPRIRMAGPAFIGVDGE